MKDRLHLIPEDPEGKACPFCPENSEKNINFVKPVEHLVIVFNTEGHTHIHGPFGNEYAIKKMADALITEMRKNGINYIPVAQQDKE